MTDYTIKFNVGGKVIRHKMHLYARPDVDEESGFRLMLVDPSNRWYVNDTDIKIDTVLVEYMGPDDITREQLILKSIESLRDKQKQAMAEAERQVSKLQDRINKLLLLTHQKEEPDVVANQ